LTKFALVFALDASEIASKGWQGHLYAIPVNLMEEISYVLINGHKAQDFSD